MKKRKWISCKQIGYPGIGVIFQNDIIRVMLFFIDILIVVPRRRTTHADGKSVAGQIDPQQS